MACIQLALDSGAAVMVTSHLGRPTEGHFTSADSLAPVAKRLAEETDTVPSVNQIEVHPYFAQDDVRAVNAEMGIATEAWAPIAQGGVLDDDVLIEIGKAHDKTAAQATLRWHIQRGDIIFPKSVTPSRVEENFAIFDFELTDDEMARVNGLDRGQRNGPDPDEFNWIP